MGFESGKITSIRIDVSNLTCQTQSGRIADKVSMKVSGTLAYNGPAPTLTFAPDPRIAEIASLKDENEKLQEQVRINAEGWGKALQWRKDHQAEIARPRPMTSTLGEMVALLKDCDTSTSDQVCDVLDAEFFPHWGVLENLRDYELKKLKRDVRGIVFALVKLLRDDIDESTPTISEEVRAKFWATWRTERIAEGRPELAAMSQGPDEPSPLACIRSGRVSMGQLRKAVMNAIRNPGTISANIFLAIAEAAESKEATDRLRRDIRIGVVTPEEVHDMKKASLILHVDPLGNARDVAPSPFGPSPLADIPKIMDARDATTNAICQQFALPAELCGYSPLMSLPSNPEAMAVRAELRGVAKSQLCSKCRGTCVTPHGMEGGSGGAKLCPKCGGSGAGNGLLADKLDAASCDGRFAPAEVATMASLSYPSVDPEGKIIPWTAIGCRVEFKGTKKQGVVSRVLLPGSRICVTGDASGVIGGGSHSMDSVFFLDMPQETPTPAQRELQLRNGGDPVIVDFYAGYSRDMPYKAKYGPSVYRTEREMEQEAAALKSGAMTVNEVRKKRGFPPFSDEAAIVMVAPLTDEQKDKLREAIAKQCTGLREETKAKIMIGAVKWATTIALANGDRVDCQGETAEESTANARKEAIKRIENTLLTHPWPFWKELLEQRWLLLESPADTHPSKLSRSPDYGAMHVVPTQEEAKRISEQFAAIRHIRKAKYLEAVGQEWNGTIKPIEKLSYAKTKEEFDANMAAVEKAQKAIFKTYKIDVPNVSMVSTTECDAPATVGEPVTGTCNRCKLPSKIVVCFPIEGELCEACKDVVTAAPKEDESEADRAAMMAFIGKTANEWGK